MNKYKIHNDFIKYKNFRLTLSPLLLPIINIILKKMVNRIKPSEGLIATKKKISGYLNAPIDLTILEPKDIDKNAPCLIYLHGGGFVFKAAPHHMNLAFQYAMKTPCKVVFVDYRLAPKYAFPIGVEDCYAALEWVFKNAESLGIDKNRIAIGGDSAGGNLSAAVSLMARDGMGPGICFQMLIYPCTDARQITESIKNYSDTPVWNPNLNRRMWKIYLKKGVPTKREYASLMEAASLENLPDTYVEVSEFDCLRDEGINLAEALQKSGIHVELNKTAGTIHGFEMVKNSEFVKQCITKRILILKKAFKSEVL